MSPMPKQLCPYVVTEKPGKVAWCACGESATDPYCDGSHARKNTGKQPIVVDIAGETKVAWCGCKEADSRPYCNGSHARFAMEASERLKAADISKHEKIGRKNDRIVRDMLEHDGRWRGDAPAGG